jgi:phage I-like protein
VRVVLATASHSDLSNALVSFAIANGALAAKGAPPRLKLLNWGRNETVKGPVTVGNRTVAEMAANQKTRGFEHIALDYNHQTVPGHPNFKPDPVDVAAYGIPTVIPGEGLFLEGIDWTPDGSKNSINYRDLSPTPQLDENGEVIFMHSVALCRQGAVDGLTFYDASFLKPLSSTPSMTTSAAGADKGALLTDLLKKLNVDVPANATDAQIAEAVTKYTAPAAAATTPAVQSDVVSMSAIEKLINDKLTPLSTKFESNERASLLALATSQGKVIPLTAEQINVTPLSTLGAIVENLKPTVPIEERGKGKTATEAASQLATLSAEDKQVCKALNISEADFLKGNPELAATRATV